MNTITAPRLTSDAARQRLLSHGGEPLFLANWDNAVFIHYQSDPETLQRYVPFTLDLFEGRAFVSVVAFTMRDMRPRFGGKLSAAFLKPIATHNFFNVRTYVRHNGEPAIFFMAEWLSNRLSVMLGPITFGLPYRFGKLSYANDGGDGEVRGTVAARQGAFRYRALLPDEFKSCEPGSLTEFLLERYTAFTTAGWRKQFFRVWHEPWQQCSIDVDVADDDLLGATGGWWPTAKLVTANYSPGVPVWMGRPHLVASVPQSRDRCFEPIHRLEADATKIL
ncbi:MAG TPA: DUF2071 domain-containing protein [Chthoniobacterales bacterium]|nr:DUF2071 domain-containing protein [Chthoniobacterales bacterium]